MVPAVPPSNAGTKGLFVPRNPAAEDAEDGARYTPDDAPARILLVDPSKQRRAALRLLLEQARMTVYDVGSAVEATAIAGIVRPDVVLIDLGLPDRDGMDLAEFLTRTFCPMKVLVQTDSDGTGVVPIARRIGVVDVLITGMDPGVILDAFQRATALARDGRFPVTMRHGGGAR